MSKTLDKLGGILLCPKLSFLVFLLMGILIPVLRLIIAEALDYPAINSVPTFALKIPSTADQPMVASRIAELKVGMHLRKNQVNAMNLRKLTDQIFSDPTYAKNVEKIRQSFIAVGGPEQAAEEFMSYQRKHS